MEATTTPNPSRTVLAHTATYRAAIAAGADHFDAIDAAAAGDLAADRATLAAHVAKLEGQPRNWKALARARAALLGLDRYLAGQ